MKKLQAAMRDQSAKAWKWKKIMYRVGSPMKGCHHCGEWYMRLIGARYKKWYTSGFQVFRSYDPAWAKFTYWCWECGAKDERAWENARDIGAPATQGAKSFVQVNEDGTHELIDLKNSYRMQDANGKWIYVEKDNVFGGGAERKKTASEQFKAIRAKREGKPQVDERQEKIAELERQVELLRSQLKGGVK